MQWCEYCIVDHMLESYSVAFHTKRYRRHSEKLITVCTGLTNPDPNWGTDSEDLGTTEWRWSLTLLPMLDSVTLVRFMVTLYIKPWAFFIQHLIHGHSRCREWTLLDPSAHQHPKDIDYHSCNWLLLKMGRSYLSNGSKDVWRGQVYQTSRNILLCYTLTSCPW